MNHHTSAWGVSAAQKIREMAEEKTTGIPDLDRSDFDSYYDREILPYVETFEKKRLKAINTYNHRRPITLAFLIASILASVTVFTFPNILLKVGLNSDYNILFHLISIFAFICYGWAFIPLNQVHEEINTVIYPIIFRFIDPNSSFKTQGTLNLRLFEDCGYIPKFTKAIQSDHLKISINGIEIEMSDVRLMRTKGKNLETIFDGQLILLPMNKPFDSHTVVKKDAGKIENWFKGQFGYLTSVKLEDPVFENKYEVYSTNQLEARYILTPSFMERILDLQTHQECDTIEMAFFHDKALLMIPSGSRRFGINTLDNEMTFKPEAEKILSGMNNIYEIVKILNLQQRTGL